jgi:glycosyltransferase involved in cell wall biosynthesis
MRNFLNHGESNPSFTVVVPVFNGEKTIHQCVMSILNQTHSPNEIIIIDDGSNDKTGEIIKNKFSVYPEIKYLYQQNQGVSSARNLGIKNSNSENVMFLDADDYWLPNKVELHFKHLIHHPGCMASFTNFYEQNQDSVLKPNKYKNTKSFTPNNLLLNFSRINGSASSFVGNKESLDSLNGFRNRLKFGEDLDLWVMFSKYNKICEIDDFAVVIQSNVNKYFKVLGNNSWKISKLYCDLWDFHGVDLSNTENRAAARQILRTDLRKNVFNPPYFLWKFPLFIKKHYPSIFEAVYNKLFFYYLYLVIDTFIDIKLMIRRLCA